MNSKTDTISLKYLIDQSKLENPNVVKMADLSDEILREIHQAYRDGNFFPCDFLKVFGIKKPASIISFFKRRGLKPLAAKEAKTIYRDRINFYTTKTNIEKYGVEHLSRTKEFRERVRRTNLEKYGAAHPIQSKEIQEKIKQTNLEKYGETHPMKNKDFRMKTEETMLERYGVRNASLSPEIQKKRNANNVSKWGNQCTAQSPVIKEKIKQTNLERYGVECPFGSPEIQEKIKQTNLERYGHPHATQNPEIMEEIQARNVEKYGVYWPSQTEEYRKNVRETRKKNDERFRLKHEILDRYESGEIDEYMVIDEIAKAYSQTQSLNILKEIGVKNEKTFVTEEKVKSLLESLGIPFIQNAKKFHGIRKSKLYYDADFLIPDQNLVIEANGLAFHSTNEVVSGNAKEKDYHFNKFKAFYDAGYRMISFTDYELDRMWSSVTEIIKFHLGLVTELSESTKVEYQEFLGYPIEESLNYGFFNKNDLNFENFRSPEEFIVPKKIGRWEYWDCGRVW